MQPHQPLHQGQADPRALERPAGLALDAVEALEQARQFVGGNADPGILHAQLDGAAVRPGLHLDLDLAVERELEGIGQEIEDDLFPHVAIDIDGLGERGAIDTQAKPGLLHRRAEIRRKLGGQRGKIDRLERRLHASRLDSGKVEQRVDELEQAQSVAMRDLDEMPMVGTVRRRSGQRLLERPEHQGQRRAELVADIGEERRLGAVELGERFGALALLLIGRGIGDPRRDLSGHQIEESRIALIEPPIGIDPDDEESRRSILALAGNGHDGGFGRRPVPIADRQHVETRGQIGHNDGPAARPQIVARPDACSSNIDAGRRRRVIGRNAGRTGQFRHRPAVLEQVGQSERHVPAIGAHRACDRRKNGLALVGPGKLRGEVAQRSRAAARR